jgi:hypothetical protein
MSGSVRGSVREAGSSLARVLYTGPFHAAFRAAVTYRGLTLERLRAHLARRGITVGLSSLSDWQLGHRRPAGANSLQAVLALEEILGLPPRALIRLLMTPVGGEVRTRRGLDEHSGVLADLLDELPGARDRTVDILNAHEKVSIDADRRVAAIWLRTVVRARRDGVDRYVVRFFGDPGCAVSRIAIDALENCRLGRVLRHPAGVLVAEVLFGEALRAGETWVYETRIADGNGPQCTEHAHGFRYPGEQYVLEVRFDPAALPVDCHVFAQPGLYDERHRTADITLNAEHAAHLYAAGTETGLLGIGWRWP